MDLKLSPLKTSFLAAVPSVNRKLLTHILTNVPIHPLTHRYPSWVITIRSAIGWLKKVNKTLFRLLGCIIYTQHIIKVISSSVVIGFCRRLWEGPYPGIKESHTALFFTEYHQDYRVSYSYSVTAETETNKTAFQLHVVSKGPARNGD